MNPGNSGTILQSTSFKHYLNTLFIVNKECIFFEISNLLFGENSQDICYLWFLNHTFLLICYLFKPWNSKVLKCFDKCNKHILFGCGIQMKKIFFVKFTMDQKKKIQNILVKSAIPKNPTNEKQGTGLVQIKCDQWNPLSLNLVVESLANEMQILPRKSELFKRRKILAMSSRKANLSTTFPQPFHNYSFSNTNVRTRQYFNSLFPDKTTFHFPTPRYDKISISLSSQKTKLPFPYPQLKGVSSEN